MPLVKNGKIAADIFVHVTDNDELPEATAACWFRPRASSRTRKGC